MRQVWSARRTLPKNMGTVLLSGWLVAHGVVPLVGLEGDLLTIVLNVVAILAGILLFFDR